MRSGIYLGPPIGRARRLAGFLFWVGSLATSLNIWTYARERTEVGVIRESLARQESVGGQVLSDALGDDGPAVLARLRAASALGVAVRISPTEMLQLLGGALPEQVALVRVNFEPSSLPPSLLVEAVARREGDITALQKRVADSRRVSATQLLGERTFPDGTLSVRLQVDLALER